jgi:arsenite methyltransferase
VKARFFGCGSPVPPLVNGLTTLDLGCGSGRDTYVLAQLVGPSGLAIGVDMTPEQLAVAEGTEAWHASKFGFPQANTKFVRGNIEDLRAAGIADASVDIVVSNCVLNLASDKAAVFREIARVLKPGGELYFSDVYADRRIPEALQRDKVLWGEVSTGFPSMYS